MAGIYSDCSTREIVIIVGACVCVLCAGLPCKQRIHSDSDAAATHYHWLWHMVHEHKCVTIVMLHPRDEAATVCHYLHTHRSHKYLTVLKGKGSPYSVTERRVPELIPVHGSQSAGDMSHKPGGRLPLLSTRPAVTPATLKRASTSFAAWWTEAHWVWTVCLRLLPDSIETAIWTQTLLHLNPSHQGSYMSEKTE